MARLDDNKKITKESMILRSPLDVVLEKIKQTRIYPPGSLSGKILKDLLTSDNASSSYSSQEDLDELGKDEMPDYVDLEGSVIGSECGIKRKGFSKETKMMGEFDSLKMPNVENPWTQRMLVKKYQDVYEEMKKTEKGNREAEGMKDQEFKKHNGKSRSRNAGALGGVWVMELENVVSGEGKFENC